MYHYIPNNLNKNLENYYSYNYGATCVLFFITILISYFSDKSYFKGIITIFIASFITWYCHYAMHLYPYFTISKIHNLTHHSPFSQTLIGKLLEYFIIEFIFFGAGLLLLLVIFFYKFFGFYILNPYILFFWASSVPLVHEFYYHQSDKNNIHKMHHKNNLTNLGPDIWDLLMKTKNIDTKIEDETTISLIMLVWAIILIPFIGSKFDIIKYLSKTKA